MCVWSATVPTVKVLQLQELVKQYDLRFVGGLLIAGEHTYVRISGEHTTMDAVNGFLSDWRRLTAPPVKESVRKPRMWVRIRKLLGL